MYLIHGGASFRIFNETVYVHGNNAADLIASIDEAPDIGTRNILKQV